MTQPFWKTFWNLLVTLTIQFPVNIINEREEKDQKGSKGRSHWRCWECFVTCEVAVKSMYVLKSVEPCTNSSKYQRIHMYIDIYGYIQYY
jgi:hypothetical protein